MSDETRSNEDQYAGTGFFDDLTWLPSRLLFRDRAERAIAWADRHGARMAVLFLEVGDFDELRRTIGSDSADDLLRDLGNRLVASLRAEDSVSRTRTAEYAILLPEVDSAAGASLVGDKVLAVFEQPFEAAGDTEVKATVGAAVYPDHALTIVGLLTAADNALKHGKREGSATVVVYSEEMARPSEGEAPSS